jgi:hypothetical protein
MQMVKNLSELFIIQAKLENFHLLFFLMVLVKQEVVEKPMPNTLHEKE